MSVYLDEAKSTFLRFADQLLREIQCIHDDSQVVKMVPRTTLEYAAEAQQVRSAMCDAETTEALQKAHDGFASLATKVMFHRLAVKLHYRDTIERGDLPRLKVVE